MILKSPWFDAESIPSSLAHADEPKARCGAKAENRILKMAAAREAYVTAAYDALLLLDEVAWFVVDIPDIEGNVLFDRYIMCKSWQQIADDRSQPQPTLFSAHRRGLQLVQAKLDNCGNGVVKSDTCDNEVQ